MPAASSRKGPTAQPLAEPGLPAHYTDIRAILDESVSPGQLVSVIGVVKDCQLPVPTNGADHKSTLSLYDLSVEDDETRSIKLVMFLPEADMPKVAAGDVVLIFKAKVQRYQANPLSLITNRLTAIRVYSASKIPKPPQQAQVALAPASKRHSYLPTAQDNAYVSHLYHKIDKYHLPDEHDFQQRAAASLNIKSKFSLLKDVQEGNFYDLIAQVARDPYPGFDVATLYVSDYTENPKFHPHTWQGYWESGIESRDPFGYTTGATGTDKKEWVGPYGKMSIQITCFEPHATVVRDEVRAGQWVALRNVQIRYGRDGQYLEGFLREERNFVGTKVNVQVLEIGDPEAIDRNLKEAIRRYRDYSKKKKKQIQEVKAAHAAGLKRKAASTSDPEKPSLNAKERRRLKRAAKEQKEHESRANEALRLGLNEHVTCETHDAPYSTIESIREPAVYEKTVNGQITVLVMPFTCAKYRARVRVIDFFPPSLEDFACRQKQSVYDVLSDDGSDSDDCPSSSSSFSSSSSSFSPSDDPAVPGARRVWEWRFALLLEDPAPPAADGSTTDGSDTRARARIWVFVDNAEAQCLTGLDATDLREDGQALARLRERMFTLWGNLEEHKAQLAERKRRKTRRAGADGEEARLRPRPGGKRRLQLEKPPIESSDVEDDEAADRVEPVSNKPFACCIREYGVYEKDREKGNRWVRCWGLFGTKISG